MRSSTSSQNPALLPRLTPAEYAVQAGRQHTNVEDTDGITHPIARHEKMVDLNDKLILWLQCQKLKPEDESRKSFPTQLNDMISVMISY